jgi:hypothetical protein
MMTSVIASLMAAVSVAAGATSQPAAEEAAAYRELPMHRVQVIGSHNSYKRAPQPELMRLMSLASRETEGIDYGHVSITDQLNLGLRNLELDVLHDPEGGRYATPLGNRLLVEAGGVPWEFDAKGELREPGFKVSHDADFDFRSWHHTLASALGTMREWSEANPGHVPIIVTLNCKQGKGHVPGATDAAEFDVAAMRALDAAMATGVGDARVLRPDAVRGESATLREAVTARGWPTVEAAKGKFVFVLDEGGQTRARYLEAFPGLRGAAMFVDVSPDQPEAALFVINDPVRDEARIRDLTEKGFMVRTRADANTTEARREDFTRFEAAKRSGAQIITTDYYIPDRKFSDRYVVRFDDGGFVRQRPASP